MSNDSLNLRIVTLVALGLVAVLVMAFPAKLFADLITITQTGTGNGKIGSTPFSGAQFTITGVGNSSNRVSFVNGFFIDHSQASISLAGLGDYQFNTATRTFVNNFSHIPGFSRAGTSGADLYNGPTDAAFANWNMLTSIGPITGPADLMQWTSQPVVTTGGILVFNSSRTTCTFLATVVPEPSTLALLGVGAISLRAYAWRRRKRAA